MKPRLILAAIAGGSLWRRDLPGHRCRSAGHALTRLDLRLHSRDTGWRHSVGCCSGSPCRPRSAPPSPVGAARFRTQGPTSPTSSRRPERTVAPEEGRVEAGVRQSREPEMPSIEASKVRRLIVACDAGMGSSVMLASTLKKQLKKTDVTVEHTPVHTSRPTPSSCCAITGSPSGPGRWRRGAVVVSFQLFLGDPAVAKVVEATQERRNHRWMTWPPTAMPAGDRPARRRSVRLGEQCGRLGGRGQTGRRAAGRRRRGRTRLRRPDGRARRDISTFVGEGFAIPHGTLAGRDLVSRDALAVVQFPDGVDWHGERVEMCIGIAASGDVHVPILAQLAEILMEPDHAEALRTAATVDAVFTYLTPSDDDCRRMSMKAARFYAPGDIRLEDVDEPTAGPGDVVIRVRNCSTCGTDVKISRHGHHHIVPPRTMGHEIAGEIVELGGDVDGWAVGDRVQVIAAIPCGICPDCRAGRLTICPNQTSMGYHFDGAFAEYCRVPAAVLAVDGLNRIPDNVSFAEASVAEPLACVINGQQLARVADGDDVVILGAGPIGCLHVRVARGNGAKRVYLLDLNEARLAEAQAAVAPDATILGGPGRRRTCARPDRRARRRRGDHRHCRRRRPGAGAADARPAGPDEPVRWAAQGPADDHARLEPRPLPRADARRRQRFEPGPQQAGARRHRVRVGARRRSDHAIACRSTACSTRSTSSPAAMRSR